MNKGKIINMFLINGDVTDAIKCTMANWTGIVYKTPRTRLDAAFIKNRVEFKYSGVYILIGKDDNTDRNIAYIGQAGSRNNGKGVFERIIEHTKDEDKNYFNEVIIITTQTNIFGATEISYLENKLTNLALEAKRYSIQNKNKPNLGNITEEKEAELNEVIENTKMIIGTLGHKIFIPLIQKEEIQQPAYQENELLLFLSRKTKKSGKTIEAKCKRTNEGFVILKGSMVEMEDSTAIPDRIKQDRQILQEKGIIQNGILQENQLYASPSYAAAFVLGGNTNGRIDWKNEKGQTLKEIEDNATD